MLIFLYLGAEAKTKVLIVDSSLLFTLGLPVARLLSIPLHRIVLLDTDTPSSKFFDHELYDLPNQHIVTVEELIALQKINNVTLLDLSIVLTKVQGYL